MGHTSWDLAEGVGRLVNTLRQVAAGIEQLEETTRRLVKIHASAEERALQAQAREDLSRDAETVARAEERAREARAREDALREQLESEQKRLLDEIRARDEERAREARAREDAFREQLESAQKRLLDEIRARDEERAREARAREDAFREQLESAQKRLLDEIRARDEERARKAQAREGASRQAEEAVVAKADVVSATLLSGMFRRFLKLTAPQVQAEMERIQYDPDKLHFGVCGASGSGKSSLVNAFRGLSGRSDLAAAVGVTETISEVTRYPDSRNEAPYASFVWYDIPGAGTTAVPDWQYFNDQGLFMLDFIVMVYDVRFAKIFIKTMMDYNQVDIPVFIVHSKADQHIDNMMKGEGFDFIIGDEFEKVYQEMKTKYVEATRSDFRKQIKAMAEVDPSDRELILSERVYIVSCANVQKLVQSGVNEGVDKRKMIDEVVLVEDMLRAAARLRHSELREAGHV